MNRRLLPALLASLALTAQAADEAIEKPAEASAAETARLPKQELTPQLFYKFLLAEIAGARGQIGLSAEAYLDLARTTRDPRVARRAAEIAMFARRYDAALEAARLWSEIEPESQQARQMVTALLAAANRTDELSTQVARDLAGAGKDVGPLLLQLNRILARYPDKVAARQLVIKVTEPYLDVPEAHFARAQAAHNARDAAQAVVELDKALSLRPDWEQAAVVRAQLTGDGAEAGRFLERFLAVNPKASEARLAYARGLVGEKRYADARREFQTLLADNPGNGDVTYAVAVLSLQLGDIDEAEKQFRRLVDTNHGEANSARIYLGQIAEDRKQWDEALKWFGQVTPGNQYLPARMRIALTLARQKRIDEARQALHETVAASPAERVQLLIAESQLLRDAGRVQDAYGVLADELAAEPDQPELLYETALLAERLGRMDVLERNLRRLIELKPDYAHAYNALGYSFADRNERLEEAQQLVDQALRLAPDDPFILDSKGWVLFRRGDAAGALDVLQKAFALRADPEIAAHLGEVLWSLGRHDDALKIWDDAIKAHPDNEAVVGTRKKFKP